MARPIEDIKDLHDKRQGTTFRIVVRIVSLWVVQKHQPPKNGHLEMILMDAKVCYLSYEICGLHFPNVYCIE